MQRNVTSFIIKILDFMITDILEGNFAYFEDDFNPQPVLEGGFFEIPFLDDHTN